MTTFDEIMRTRAPYKRAADLLGAELYGWTETRGMTVLANNDSLHFVDEWTVHRILALATTPVEEARS